MSKWRFSAQAPALGKETEVSETSSAGAGAARGPCLAGELALPDITRSDHAVPQLSASPVPRESGLRFAINKQLRGTAHARERGCFPQKGVRIIGKVKEHFVGKAVLWCFSPLCDAGCRTTASLAVMCSHARTHKALLKTPRSDPPCWAALFPRCAERCVRFEPDVPYSANITITAGFSLFLLAMSGLVVPPM